MSNMTQHDKIIKIMESNPSRWWKASDFMQSHLQDLFVGYEATARLSELAKKGLIESRRNGKFMERRLIVEAPEEETKAVSWLND